MPSDSIETPSGARASELRAEIARLTRTRDALREAVASERSEKSDAPFDERSMAFTLTSALSELVWLQTADGALVYCSPSVERALGWRLEELAALDLMELVHPADAADASTLLEPRGSGASAPVELRVRRKDDGYVWMESRVMAVTLDGVRHRLFLSTEISRRKQAELKLLEHESWTRRLIDRSALGIFRASADGRFLQVNPALASMLGYASAGDLVGKSLRELVRDRGDGGSEVDTTDVSDLLPQESEHGSPTFSEARWQRKDGSELLVRVSTSLVLDADGSLEGCDGIVEDVTEHRRKEMLLQRAERMASLGRMLAGIAHELNNPLAAICGFAQLLRRSSLTEEDRSAVDTIEREGQRAARIVRQLLGFARHDGAVRLEPVDAAEVLGYTARAQRYAMETHGIRCIVDVPDESLWIEADRAQLEQIVLNLLVNARQACEELLEDRERLTGDAILAEPLPAPFVKLSAYRQGDMVTLEVSDSGAGIPAENLPRIWDPFWTTKADGEGTGLGLAVVHAGVASLGGQIEVVSDTSNGTSFRLSVPASDTPAGSPDHRGHAGDDAPAVLDVLLVGSMPVAVRFAERFLSDRGHAVIPVATLDAAVQTLEATPFDVVILNLPAASGKSALEAVHRLRSEAATSAPRVVIAAQRLSRGTRDELREMADVVVLEHPADVDELRLAVEGNAHNEGLGIRD